jgi:exosome complex component RRP41
MLVKKDGTRLDGRKPDEIRPLHIEAGVLDRADGSAYLEWGKNKIMAAVYGPREYMPKRFQKADKCVIRARYNMAAFSVGDRKRPGPDRRSQEISKVISDAFENVVLTHRFPRGVIDVHMEVLQADAGTRCAALAAATVALADAGIPMKGLVAAVAAGKAGGQIILDLDQPEDNFGQADLPVAVNMTSGEVVLLQMDGHLTDKEFEQALDMAVAGCKQVYEAQRAALLRRFEAQAAADGVEVTEAWPSEEETRQPGDDGRGGRRDDGGRGGGRGGDRGGGRGGPRGGGRGGDRGGGRGGPRGGGRGDRGGRGDDRGGRGDRGGRTGAGGA